MRKDLRHLGHEHVAAHMCGRALSCAPHLRQDTCNVVTWLCMSSVGTYRFRNQCPRDSTIDGAACCSSPTEKEKKKTCDSSCSSHIGPMIMTCSEGQLQLMHTVYSHLTHNINLEQACYCHVMHPATYKAYEQDYGISGRCTCLVLASQTSFHAVGLSSDFLRQLLWCQP